MVKRRAGRRRGRRRSRSSGPDRTTVLSIMATIGLVCLLGFGGYRFFQATSSRPTYDETSLCPEDGPSGEIVILLDLTDPLTPQQGTRLQTLLDRIIRSSPDDTMISFGVVSSDPGQRGARFARCKPRTGKDASAIYENPALIGQRFDEEFLEPVQTGLASAIAGAVEDTSPIMESLQALLADTPSFETGEGPKEIVIASDLLQNSDVISFYRGEGWDALRASGGQNRLARNLDGARITIFRVPRPTAGETARAQADDFWSRYFDYQGAAAPISVQSLGDL